MLTRAPKGTKDILPEETWKWQAIEKTAADICSEFGYREIRTPVFEHTELFQRGVGDSTDIVRKEMYTFTDKGDRSITLRPEGTAGVVRSYVENGMASLPHPVKLYYFMTIYRYEKMQKGRLREHHQFGVEVFGPEGPGADVEVICLLSMLFDRLKIKGVKLRINSIGCPKCRPVFRETFIKYLEPLYDDLCDACKTRYNINPMRIMDCKSETCSNIVKGAPSVTDYLCRECAVHFEGLKAGLENMGIVYTLDRNIVRGQDYYTRTVFEFVSDNVGAQGTVCGGGRYDGLVAECGGPSTPGIGFGLGMERLFLEMDSCGCPPPGEEPQGPAVYIAVTGREADAAACKLACELRKAGISAETDLMGRSLKAQMKYADKIGAAYTIVIGSSEMDSGSGEIKDMKTGITMSIQISADKIAEIIREERND
ncbi:MAG: histidine--tRNA ligase [Eubacteriales bacterium]|nr:histidine--tRNA ligase [Eubacteriales bacterium]